MTADLLLSSGFLAFGRQAGFLQGVEDSGLEVGAVVGTSSGALAGSLWASGLSAQEVFEALTERSPLASVRPCWQPWRGLLSMSAVVRDLRDRLPVTFAELPRPFAVGVMGPDGSHRLVREGPLAEAVAASCAIPTLFAPVHVHGEPCRDGGFTDRIGARAWRAWRGDRTAVAHLVDRSGGTDADPAIDDLLVVRSGRSFAKLWDLGDVGARFEETRVSTITALRHAGYALGGSG